MYYNTDCSCMECRIIRITGISLEDIQWKRVVKAERNRLAIKAENELYLYAHKPEVEFEIEKILFGLLHNTAYIEEGR